MPPVIASGTPATATNSASAGPRELDLDIVGMTCASCAARVEHRLNSVPDVTARVNLATDRASVRLGADVEVARLVEAVRDAGYQASVVEPEGVSGSVEALSLQHLRRLRHRFILAGILFPFLFELSITMSLFPGIRFPGWQWLLLTLAAPVVVWSAQPFHQAALRNARHLSASMDTLISLGIVASVGWSVYVMFFAIGGAPGGVGALVHPALSSIYLDVAGGLTAFMLLGRMFEATAKKSATSALRSLAALGAKDATLLSSDGEERHVPVSWLREGDRFLVHPGETVATDGTVTEGRAAIDVSIVTGESAPREAGPGDRVVGGTVALDGRLTVLVTEVGPATQLSQMVRLVEQAQNQRAAVQRLADRIAGVFVPGVMSLAAATVAIWLLLGHPWALAFTAGLAVLIIACPCALGLATPIALVAACGRGAQMGILIREYRALEQARLIDTVVLDKTGTVTTGRLRVAAVHCLPGVDRTDLLRLAGSVEAASEHAVGMAVAREARSLDPAPAEVADFRALPGLGARGVVEGRQVMIGRARAFHEAGMEIPESLGEALSASQDLGQTTVVVGWGGEVRGGLALSDELKPSSAAAVAELRQLGLNCMLLTGDNRASARRVGAALGIQEVVAGVLPSEKVATVRALQAAGRKVAMVGDGINDAPALAAADLGLAMGSGADIARNAADIIVLREDLGAVADAVRLARQSDRTIRRNLAWAFGYNLAALPVAALGLLDPLIAAAAMACSSALVVWNSMRLRRFQTATRSQMAAAPAEPRMA